MRSVGDRHLHLQCQRHHQAHDEKHGELGRKNNITTELMMMVIRRQIA
jgi:hypothetical protein